MTRCTPLSASLVLGSFVKGCGDCHYKSFSSMFIFVCCADVSHGDLSSKNSQSKNLALKTFVVVGSRKLIIDCESNPM